MQTENVIEVKNITKSFKIYIDKGKTLKDKLSILGRGGYQKHEVLRGISFNVKRGEAIGLIGKNGCGKSTTLKLLTRIMYPDTGYIEIRGKVSSLLELGAGFHPDMSGRENIYLNASVFGLTKREIDKKVDEIIRFSELEEFIENPVRTYSSGMYMRLAFSVAINVDAEILLIDEILGVGDVSFQKKCFEKLKEIKMAGTTIVIVSHSLNQIEQICDRSIWISNGMIQEEGKPRIVNAHYYQAMEEERLNRCEEVLLNHSEAIKKEDTNVNKENSNNDKENNSNDKKNNNNDKVIKNRDDKMSMPRSSAAFYDKRGVRTGNRKVEFVGISLRNSQDLEKTVFVTNDTIKVNCKMKSNIGTVKVSVSISLWRDDGLLCYGVNSYRENGTLFDISGDGSVELDFTNINLLGGKYWLNVSVFSEDLEEYDIIKNAKQLYIRSMADEKEHGVYQMEHTWRNFK